MTTGAATVGEAVASLQHAPEAAELRDIAQALHAQLRAAPLATLPRLVAPPRWHGAVVTRNEPMHQLFGETPASWLARQGVYLDVLRLVDQVDAGRFLTLPLATPRWLIDDAAAAALLPISEAIQRAGGQVFVAVFDDYWSPPPAVSAGLSRMLARSCVVLERRLRSADGVVVNSPRLAEVVARFTPRVVVLPVALPPLSELPPPRPIHRGRARRVGYAGTYLHTADLDLLRQPMLEWLSCESEAVFVLAGQAFPAWTMEHPRIERHPGGMRLSAYYRWLRALDLDAFVVPLGDHPFNAAKAILKPLEATAIGYPCIVSDVAPYRGVLSRATGHIMVENTTTAWRDALDRLTEDDGLRLQLAASGRAWAGTKTIDATGPMWEQFWTGH
jgi:glycosyltransferase involved in cell wall biosynthesis